MAKIVKIIKSNTDYSMRNDVTDCIAEYNQYTQQGERFVWLQTFGSKLRQDKGKQSQVLHIDKKIAEQLIEMLQDTFELKK